MADKDRKEIETPDVALPEKKENTPLTDNEMSKISGGSVEVEIGPFGLPNYSVQNKAPWR